jgi:hypothetical protein
VAVPKPEKLPSLEIKIPRGLDDGSVRQNRQLSRAFGVSLIKALLCGHCSLSI